MIKVYDQIAAEGIIESRVGAGAYVNDTLELRRPRKPQAVDSKKAKSGQRPRLASLCTNASEQYFPRLAPEFDEAEVARRAAAQGIVVTPISRFSLAPTAQRGLILGFSAIPPRAIESGIEALAGVLAAARARAG